MIAKIMKGSDFKGVVYYILNDEKGTQIIDSDGLFLENNYNCPLNDRSVSPTS